MSGRDRRPEPVQRKDLPDVGGPRVVVVIKVGHRGALCLRTVSSTGSLSKVWAVETANPNILGGPGRLRADELRFRSDEAGRDEAGRDEAGRDEAGRDEAGRDEAGRDEAGRDEAGRDEAGRDEAGRDEAGRDVPSDPADKNRTGR
ncbi:unnamed protein product [Lota lota]